ncbi:Amiloride-sensitive sodium channel subunit like protein [Argiope bruennichi]|uniref:Amiloride-sensitive sodium channel subunit like protein n=1 Tax=Argiope bruennichi TaxID=94029 RepID=A0A8T0G329_ARGBR|nr:Amiloride-sensitive sodium channel subunit like protein [Argiope bruennichi]
MVLPMTKTEWHTAKCRGEVLRNFTDSGNDCDDICKPSCKSIRYDISLSKADWPNLNHQQFVMNRSFEQWRHIPEALGLLDSLEYEGGNVTDIVNDTFFSENLLRVHVFIEEMIYMSIEETYSYTLPKLMADLGGCLGLYLGVSVISIIEFIDLFGSTSLLCLLGTGDTRSSERRTGSRKRRKRNRTSESGPKIDFFRRRSQANKNIFRNVDHGWRNSAFSTKDVYYQNEGSSRKQGMRWS